MLWHLLAASTLLCLLKWRRLSGLLRDGAGIRTTRGMGFAFATVYALVTVPFSVSLFDGQPMPRFNDIFLIGVVLTVYFFSWGPAVYLLAVAVLASAWILPPYGSMAVEGFHQWYRLLSFTGLAAFLVILLTRIKAQLAAREGHASSRAIAAGD